jgi:hypothetical protein
MGYGSWGLPSKALIDAASQSCDRVMFEISPETSDLNLRKINKDPRIFYTDRELEECLDHMATKPNIKVQLYFVYVLPFDTRETIFNTFDYILELFLKYSSFTEIIYSNLSTDPCSSLYCQPEKYNVDIAVGNFADYIKKLEETYIINKEIPFGGMNLFKPAYMSDMEFADIKNKADLFNKLLSSFGQSLQLTAKRRGNLKIVTEYLKEIDLSMVPAKDFTPARVKSILSALCHDNGITGSEILGSIDKEFESAASKVMEKAQGQKYNAGDKREFEPGELVIITEEEKNKLRWDLQKAKQEIHAEFDI